MGSEAAAVNVKIGNGVIAVIVGVIDWILRTTGYKDNNNNNLLSLSLSLYDTYDTYDTEIHIACIRKYKYQNPPPLELSVSGLFIISVYGPIFSRHRCHSCLEAIKSVENKRLSPMTPPMTPPMTHVFFSQRWGNKQPETVTMRKLGKLVKDECETQAAATAAGG